MSEGADKKKPINNAANYKKRWARANPEKVAAANRKWRVANPEKMRTLQAAWSAKKKAENPAYYREKYLERAYGMTAEEHAALFAAQGYACAVCGAEEPGTKAGWHTDHSHANGKVRGILCHPCNVALGMAKDSVERLELLVLYLRRHA